MSLIAALIAARTGQARGYFLLGIWRASPTPRSFVVSMLVRRPIVGVLWEFLDPTPGRGRDAVVPAPRRCCAPICWPPLPRRVVFLARGIVQLALFQHNATGWLAFARIAMGFPLYIAAVGVRLLGRHAGRKRVVPTA